MKKYFLVVAVFISCVALAQDTIIKKNGDLIKAKITEIGTEEVKFKLFGEQDGPLITLKRSEIKIAKVAGQKIIDVKIDTVATEDIIVKKSGEILKVKVTDIGTEEVKFKLFNNPDGPTITLQKMEIKTMVVNGQTVIDVKKGAGEDIITKKDGTVIKAKITEIGTEDIKYKLANNPNGPILVLSKSDVETAKIDGQVVYKYKADPLSVSNDAIIDRTSTVKFYFLSPLSHHIDFGYEWMNKPGFNWDVAVGVIGPGIGTSNKSPKGLFFRGGPKFLLGSTSNVVTANSKERYAHPLKGSYIKLEIILNAFSTTYRIDTSGYYGYSNTPQYLVYKKKYQSVTLDVQFGKQYVVGNIATFAYYLGLGYSLESVTNTLPARSSNFSTNIADALDLSRYSHTYFGQRFPMIFTFGITIGYIMPTPKWKKATQKTSYTLPSGHEMKD